MFVAMVTLPRWPASATISASFSCCLALSTLCGTPRLLSSEETSSDFSMDTVPTSTGWPRLWQSSISRAMALNFSAWVLKIMSGWSLRTMGLLVGMTMTSRS